MYNEVPQGPISFFSFLFLSFWYQALASHAARLIEMSDVSSWNFSVCFESPSENGGLIKGSMLITSLSRSQIKWALSNPVWSTTRKRSSYRRRLNRSAARFLFLFSDSVKIQPKGEIYIYEIGETFPGKYRNIKLKYNHRRSGKQLLIIDGGGCNIDIPFNLSLSLLADLFRVCKSFFHHHLGRYLLFFPSTFQSCWITTGNANCADEFGEENWLRRQFFFSSFFYFVLFYSLVHLHRPNLRWLMISSFSPIKKCQRQNKRFFSITHDGGIDYTYKLIGSDIYLADAVNWTGLLLHVYYFLSEEKT